MWPRLLLPLLLLVPTHAAAQDPAPPEKPADAADAADDADGVDDPPRALHQAALEATTVHFAFQRAPLEDVLEALRRATGVPIRLGAAAAAKLKERRFKLRYVADRTGVQVLDDVTKASALDWVTLDAGVRVDLPARIGGLRRKLGLEDRRPQLTPEEVARLLAHKRLTLSVHERPLDRVLSYLRRETGIRLVPLGALPDPPPQVKLDVTDRPLREVLDAALAPLGQDWLRVGNVVLVGPRDAVAKQRAAQQQRR